MTLQKKDFVEIEFTGRIKDGEIFDSNIKGDLEKMNHEGHDHEPDKHPSVKPFVFSLGEGMFLKGVEDFLIGKPSPSKPINYEIEISPENAFGNRDPKLVQLMPMKIFIQQKLNPVPGAVFNFDGRMAKILSVSGGRVMVDFNHPIAGKVVAYKINLLKKVTDSNERAKALIDFLFRREFKFTINEKDKKIILEVEKPIVKFAELFKDKFKEILGLDLEVKEIKELKELKKASESKEDKESKPNKKSQ